MAEMTLDELKASNHKKVQVYGLPSAAVMLVERIEAIIDVLSEDQQERMRYRFEERVADVLDEREKSASSLEVAPSRLIVPS